MSYRLSYSYSHHWSSSKINLGYAETRHRSTMIIRCFAKSNKRAQICLGLSTSFEAVRDELGYRTLPVSLVLDRVKNCTILKKLLQWNSTSISLNNASKNTFLENSQTKPISYLLGDGLLNFICSRFQQYLLKAFAYKIFLK